MEKGGREKMRCAMRLVVVVVMMMTLGGVWCETAQAQEKECREEAAKVEVPMILLAVLPPVVNLATICLLALLLVRIRAIRSANDEVFQSTMLLTRTALRVTIPRRAVEAIQKVVGTGSPEAIKTAIKTRLSPENAKKQKKNN